MGSLKTFGRRAKKLDMPTPEKGLARYFSILANHFWRFLTLDLLFLAFCLPIITIPAAICAHNRVCLLLVRCGNCFLWADFRDEFKSSFWRSIPLGLLYALGLALSYYMLSLGISNGQSLFAVVFFAIGFALALFCLISGSWSFALVAVQPLKNRDILKNANALSSLELPRGLLMVLIYGAMLAFVLLLSPYSLVILPFLLSFIQYSLCFIMNTAIDKRVLSKDNSE